MAPRPSRVPCPTTCSTPARGTEQEPAAEAAPLTYPELAVAAFNASEFPRRMAGVARSLGEPEVTVRSAEHLESIVRIVVAWELCWYRYEVDLGEQPGVAGGGRAGDRAR